jgi:hypothetical protein
LPGEASARVELRGSTHEPHDGGRESAHAAQAEQVTKGQPSAFGAMGAPLRHAPPRATGLHAGAAPQARRAGLGVALPPGGVERRGRGGQPPRAHAAHAGRPAPRWDHAAVAPHGAAPQRVLVRARPGEHQWTTPSSVPYQRSNLLDHDPGEGAAVLVACPRGLAAPPALVQSAAGRPMVCLRLADLLLPRLQVRHQLTRLLPGGQLATDVDVGMEMEGLYTQSVYPLFGLGSQVRHPPVPIRTCTRSRQQQDWFLTCLEGGWAHPLAACGVATHCCPSTGTLSEAASPQAVLGDTELQQRPDIHHVHRPESTSPA